MTIAWNAETREWHLHNGLTSWVLAVYENEWIGLLHAGALLSPGRLYRHLRAAVPRLRQPDGRADRPL
ncbi:MAG: hypothetical protein U0838_12170 [Chloroflexota bacterium]